MKALRRLPAPLDGEQVATGPVQFGDDQPGVFIRGDDAYTAYFELKTLADILKSCDTRVLCSCPPDRELDSGEQSYCRENPCPIHTGGGDEN
ncbi:hypothetical protein LCGC14_1808400 [marine sediment metagenome]|uniref:Uncharacterized protein n=1 Tax=marine sediment metagenome TaxID=412755 RepID=A0A0F9GMP3_9ZZZZ